MNPYEHHGESCTVGDEVTHRFLLADSGWWCRGCANKLVSLFPLPLKWAKERLPPPTCPACLKSDEEDKRGGGCFVATVRTDAQTIPREHP